MIIKIKEKQIELNGKKYTLMIRLLIGWNYFNVSFKMPNMTVNQSIFEAPFQLMEQYAKLELKYDNLKRVDG